MNLYLASRRRAWLSEEELAATADCSPAVLDVFDGSVCWVRSYVFREADGSFSAECLYRAESLERLEEYFDAMMLPADEVRQVDRYAAA